MLTPFQLGRSLGSGQKPHPENRKVRHRPRKMCGSALE
jgi:hypothetical protein